MSKVYLAIARKVLAIWSFCVFFIALIVGTCVSTKFTGEVHKKIDICQFFYALDSN